jgi:hypothetical protein
MVKEAFRILTVPTATNPPIPDAPKLNASGLKRWLIARGRHEEAAQIHIATFAARVLSPEAKAQGIATAARNRLANPSVKRSPEVEARRKASFIAQAARKRAEKKTGD